MSFLCVLDPGAVSPAPRDHMHTENMAARNWIRALLRRSHAQNLEVRDIL